MDGQKCSMTSKKKKKSNSFLIASASPETKGDVGDVGGECGGWGVVGGRGRVAEPKVALAENRYRVTSGVFPILTASITL